AVINLPENIKHIGKSIFYDTAYYNDKSNWENGVLYLDNYLIDANISNKNADYNIKEGTKIIAVGAFENCDDLKSLTFPESLTTIPRGICNRCNYLTTINVSDNVNYISSYAFEDCTSLENINLGDNIERIGEYAFNNTGFYNEISNWDNGVLYIDKYLISIKAGFKGSCIVKDGTIGIANSACSECDTTYYDADEYEYYNKYYDETDFNYSDAKWYGYVGLTGIKLPASVKYIGSHAFDGCDAMVSVELNEGLQVIGANAFNKCKEIYTIRIPKSVTKIGDAAIDTSIVKVIEGYENSVAQTYAKNNKIQFVNVVCKDGKEHTAVTLKAKKSTYFEKGYTTHSVCSVCGEDLSYVVYSSKLKLTKTSFSLKSGKKSFKITYKKAKGATGFQVSYKTGKGKWVTKNFNAKKKVTKTIKKLKKGKKYTVKIRVFAKINGKKVYSNRTGTRTVTVK
ncbi:MAG: leucine-rich repeat protein, partial [Clostridia bacterium]|nr:leucine-rich repeat protein [Clostridia bacterium]